MRDIGVGIVGVIGMGVKWNRDATKKRQQEKNSRILLEMDSSNPKYGKS